jgi:hypothetical protein
MVNRNNKRRFFEDFSTLYLDDVRFAVGGRSRLTRTDYFTATLPDGRQTIVRLARSPGRLGGTIMRMVCPACGRKCRTLKVVAWEPPLACVRCLQVSFSVRYRSQIVVSRANKTELSTNVTPSVAH